MRSIVHPLMKAIVSSAPSEAGRDCSAQKVCRNGNTLECHRDEDGAAVAAAAALDAPSASPSTSMVWRR